ncbi:MAG: zinc metallopeptidase, partial [Anaerotignum sp.]
GNTGQNLLMLGVLFFSLSVVFTLITLPVEFNASSRAIELLVDQNFLDSDEIGGAKKVLRAAAMTYVAAAFAAIAELLRLLAIVGLRRGDD